ncbi:MAG: TonB-dependent receptor, partial [Leptospirales bacterium]|nr:TonB-dependent receptor [Leptospirales bacterium]
WTWDSTLLFVTPMIDTRFKGAYGTSFKAPTISQLYCDGLFVDANRDLDPEKGKHYEIGIEQPFFSEAIKIGLTYFSNRYRNQIDVDWNSYPGKYENINKTESKGYESFINFKLPLNLYLSAAYTYSSTKNKDTGNELARRPKHKFDAVLNWNFYEGANLNIVYNYAGKRYDDQSNTVEMDSYSTIDVKLSYWIIQSIQVYGRVENAGNKKYQQINGYAMPQRAFYAGIEGNIM